MSDYIVKHWEMLVAFVTAVFGGLAFLDMRRRELSWKRTEFIFCQAKHLDSDEEIAKAILVLDGADPNMTIDQLFGQASNSQDPAIAEYRTAFNKLLNLLDWFAYAAFDAKSVSLQEVANFGWYLRKVRESPLLVDYCWENGFRDTLKLAKKVIEFNETRERKMSRSKDEFTT